MKPFINKLLVGMFCCCAGLLCAAEPEVVAPTKPTKDYLSCFAAWDTRLNTLQTQFVQTTQYDGMLISQSNGRILYQQQGPKLRLDNMEDKAITQTALTNKKQIYILDEKGKEISKISWKDWLAGQPNQALFDFGNYTALLAKHTVSVSQEKPQQVVLRLEPKNKTDQYVLFVTVNESDCFPRLISIQADLMTTTATLQDVVINQPLPAEAFKGLK